MTTEAQERTVTIASVVDVVGALATDSLGGHIYFLDTNREHGSTGQGTESLATVVNKGDRLVWIVLGMECEAYVSIDDILIDKNFCAPEKKFYEGTDISYWSGKVKKDLELMPYTIKLKLGSRAEPMVTTSELSLINPPA